MAFTNPPTLSTLPPEISFEIFKLFDRPSTLSLSLTSPRFSQLLARFHNFQNSEGSQSFNYRTGIDSSRKPTSSVALIRWLCKFKGPPFLAEARDPEKNEAGKAINPFFLWNEIPQELEYVAVQVIMSTWLSERFGIRGGCILCEDCGSYMLLLDRDGRKTNWGIRVTDK
ncbi:hypothetical protein BGZ60DRAFT_427405 [Tricladium varicosporioides]|nr:hypothetical protein BGZ60DRAFT_427405 [Hymenoscyphus varicosporioides]